MRTGFMANEELVKIHVDVPDNEFCSGESFWAKPLGNDLYELRNSPFYAKGFNFKDIVKAIEVSPDLKPSIIEVVKVGGHRTLWVIFLGEILESKQKEYLYKLNLYKASFEGFNDKYFAIDIEPKGDYEAVCKYLDGCEKEGILEYSDSPLS